MTREEEYRAALMRIDGFTWEKIGEEIGYSSEHVSQHLRALIRYGRAERYVYPTTYCFVRSRYGNLRKFANATSHSYAYLYRVMTGQQPMSDALADEIAALSGMTREEVRERVQV